MIHAFVNMAATGIEMGNQALAEAATALRIAFHISTTSDRIHS
jgi:hypothetical protein